MTSRTELRSFGANLVLGAEALFFGSAFFIYCFRRAHAAEWRNAWAENPELRPLLLATIVVPAALPWLHRMDRTTFWVFGQGAAVVLPMVASMSHDGLRLPGGSRAPEIAVLFFTVVFAAQGFVLLLAGMLGRRGRIFRRFLWFQAVAALLILPLVFSW